jgi:hypothetical protein
VIDSERQLSGKVVDERSYSELGILVLIDTVLTMPAATVEKCW